MKTYLVTGGAGFIGSHLCDALLAAGHRIIVLDDLSTGTVGNIVHLKHHPSFECFIDTVFNRPLLETLIARADAVLHLAGQPQVGTGRPVHRVEHLWARIPCEGEGHGHERGARWLLPCASFTCTRATRRFMGKDHGGTGAGSLRELPSAIDRGKGISDQFPPAG